MPEREPVEDDDRWRLGLRGLVVTRIGVDFQLRLALGQDWEVVLEAPAYLGPVAGPAERLTPATQDVGAALPLFGAKVLSAVAFKSGSLRLAFDTPLMLTCPADPDCEAWQIMGPGGRLFVSQPGKGLAVRPVSR
ncbi:DUF6188 family protein [Streptomyces beijiangensis]|uniref:Uncharacterized protein n=2 Tax=Streptomyces beijiangensis TaxID=163361 RepID=A0A939JHP9_9ACTN|nr:DUF6188 family protein [Streptomyces beijiangensis]MBO0514713.1 hypothetical protein [Streptomyces beijiangensis]